MNNIFFSSWRTLSFAALLLAFTSGVRAEIYTSATYSSGPDGYSSTALSGDADLFDTPLRLNLYLFNSGAAQSDDVNQWVAGLDWDISKLVSAGIKHNELTDGTINISGNEGKLSLALNTLWKSELVTQCSLGLTASSYTPEASVNGKSLAQDRSSIGLRQGITPQLKVYVSHDEYAYDKNPKAIALALMLNRRTRSNTNLAYTLLGFPDKSNQFGINWQILESLTLDVSSGKTTTVLDQLQKNRRLGIDYQITDSVNLTAAVTKATSSEVKTAGGLTLLPATDDLYTEFTLGWAF